jgi:hypothetical protein
MQTQDKTFKITKKWLKKCATVRGGYTNAQHKVLDNFPPSAGWQSRLAGTFITEENAKKFYLARFKFARSSMGVEPAPRKERKPRMRAQIAELHRLVAQQKNALDAFLEQVGHDQQLLANAWPVDQLSIPTHGDCQQSSQNCPIDPL